MPVVVTGAAGFIGSSLVAALLARGDVVVGVDCFTDHYDPAVKRRNLAEVGADDSARFELVEVDLRHDDLTGLLDAGVDVVFHLAAQPGVRPSWSDDFADHLGHNVLATQRLLEAATASAGGVGRVVYASSSSVYGEVGRTGSTETDLPAPHSPYGVTKLAAEHLCGLYAANHGLPTVALRYFSVYGPRQRPDMAVHRLLAAGLRGTAFPIFGDGSAVRDLTFVDDVVAATLAAADLPASRLAPGTVLNVAGGTAVSLAELLAVAADVLGRPIAVERRPPQPGDVARTAADTSRAADLLGWRPATDLRTGLSTTAAWLDRHLA